MDNYLKKKIPHIYREGILNKLTIGIDDVKIIKQMGKELAEKETELSQLKVRVNNEIKEIKQMDVAIKNINDIQQQWTHLTNQFEKNIFGKIVVSPQSLNQLQEFLSGVQKNAELLKSKNYNLEKKVTKLSENIESHKIQLKGRDNQIRHLKDEKIMLTNDLIELKEQHTQAKEDRLVLKSLLKDMGKEDFSMSQLEYEGRVILENLENGAKPRNSDECLDWRETLEENREQRTIPEKRLTKWIQQLSIWLKQIFSREKQIEHKKDRGMSL